MKKVLIGFAIAGIWLYFTLPRFGDPADQGPATATIACSHPSFLQDLALFTVDGKGSEFPCVTIRFEQDGLHRRTCELDERGSEYFLIKHRDGVVVRFSRDRIPETIFVSEDVKIITSWVPKPYQLPPSPMTDDLPEPDKWHQPVEVVLKNAPHEAMVESFVLDGNPWGFRNAAHTVAKGDEVKFTHKLLKGDNWIVVRELGRTIMPNVRECGDLLAVARLTTRKFAEIIPNKRDIRLNVTEFRARTVLINQSAVASRDRLGAIAFALFPRPYDYDQSFKVWADGLFQDRRSAELDQVQLSLIMQGGHIAIYYPRLKRFWVATEKSTNQPLIVEQLDGSLRVEVTGLEPEELAGCALQLNDAFNMPFQFPAGREPEPGASRNLEVNKAKAISISADGTFHIPAIPAGPYSLRVLKGEKTIANGSVIVTSGGVTRTSLSAK